jgi:hypothetical protein
LKQLLSILELQKTTTTKTTSDTLNNYITLQTLNDQEKESSKTTTPQILYQNEDFIQTKDEIKEYNNYEYLKVPQKEVYTIQNNNKNDDDDDDNDSFDSDTDYSSIDTSNKQISNDADESNEDKYAYTGTIVCTVIGPYKVFNELIKFCYEKCSSPSLVCPKNKCFCVWLP